MSLSSKFITFEGIDGAGKSTHIEALTQRLRERGADVLNTREPGGTVLAEQLRSLFLQQPMDGLTEALLVFAGRRDHLQTVIEPALAAGRTVLCDRFTDATFAYQGFGRGMDLAVLGTLEQWVQEGRQPDLTLWFDLPAEVAAARRASARAPDRLESQDIAFFNQVRAGYAARCEHAPQRFVRIPSEGTVAEVWAHLQAALEQRGW